jgi:hypothetical protein
MPAAHKPGLSRPAPVNQSRIQTSMILRIGHSTATAPPAGESAWQAFAKTQQPPPLSTPATPAGCITQPAHAALSARIAAALDPAVFGALPPEVIDSIGQHDAGWAGPDLAALEYVGEKQPYSFLAYPAEDAVDAWRKSIREAEARSAVAGVLTSRHFCLLAPRDDDPHHAAFLEQESARRIPHEAASSIPRNDLDRYTAALGFCDLLSLCLCSGLAGAVRIPLAHPADPASQHASSVTVFFGGETLRFDRTDTESIMPPGTLLHVDGWVAFAPNVLASQRFYWTIG